MSSTAQDVKATKESVATIPLIGSCEVNYQELNKAQILGQGGFGIVYQGTWHYSEVAIKETLLPLEQLSSEAKKEFAAEVQVMASLRNPNIVQFYGYCLSPRYCIVMEYMPEGSLYNALRTEKLIDWTPRLKIATDIACGLAFLHKAKILHRDIKSLNVLLDKGLRAKLTDFGLSKIKTETLTSPTTKTSAKDSVGTLAWMAPELFKRRAVYTAKSDIYSLGVTLWELAARKNPFSDAHNPGLIQSWVEKGDREEFPEDCPLKLRSVIEACWDGDPAKRPDSDLVACFFTSKEDEDFKEFAEREKNKPAVVTPKPAAPTPQPNYQNNLASGVPNAVKPVEVQDPIQLKLEIERLKQVELQKAQAEQAQAALLKAQQEQLLLLQKQIEELKVQGTKKPEAPTPAAPPAPVTPLLDNKLQIEVKRAQELSKPKVDAAQLKTFLEHIVWGRQNEAEALLKANKDLALVAGDVTDHAKRTFRNITGFQLAVWNLDWHMWTMILRYLPPEAAKEQAQGFKTGAWVKEHAEHANWKNVIDALQVYIDKFYSWDWNQRENHWIQQVGGAQFKLPIHVLQEYNNPRRPFDPTPNFDVDYTLVRRLPDWLSSPLNSGSPFNFGMYRWQYGMCFHDQGWRTYGGQVSSVASTVEARFIAADRSSLISLLDTRRQQRVQLVQQCLTSNAVQSVKPVGK
jgi:serine/threonine protein kinase